MANREKVIEGLKHCNFGDCDRCYENDCPYYQSHDCTDELKNDILSLLKEQEPVKPIRLENWWKCASCCGNIVANMKYCPRCGRSVKWK